MPPKEPRTTREALVAEMLGDIDGLLARCEAFAGQLDALAPQLAANTATLDAAGERYRLAICTFTEQAKQQLSSYLERKAGDASVNMRAALRTDLQEAVRAALAEAASQAAPPSRWIWRRYAELAAVALGAGLAGGGLVYLLLR